MRAGDAVAPRAISRGRRVGAIAGSTNLALAETFPGAECVPFDGVSDDVFGDMLRALCRRARSTRSSTTTSPSSASSARYPGIRVAFTVATRNPWGCALRLGDDELKRTLDDGIAQADLPGGLALLAAVAALPALTLSDLAVEVLEPRAAPHDQARGADQHLVGVRELGHVGVAPCC